MRLASFRSAALLEFFLMYETDSAWMSMGIPNMVWDVQPPVRIREAIPEEVTQRTMREQALQEEARVFQVKDFPVPPGPLTKKRLP